MGACSAASQNPGKLDLLCDTLPAAVVVYVCVGIVFNHGVAVGQYNALCLHGTRNWAVEIYVPPLFGGGCALSHTPGPSGFCFILSRVWVKGGGGYGFRKLPAAQKFKDVLL